MNGLNVSSYFPLHRVSVCSDRFDCVARFSFQQKHKLSVLQQLTVKLVPESGGTQQTAVSFSMFDPTTRGSSRVAVRIPRLSQVCAEGGGR